MTETRLEHVSAGLSGHVGRYDVFTQGDQVTIIEDTKHDPRRVERQIDGLGEFIEDAEALRLGWGEFPDGMEVVYLYDKADRNYGYAVNLDSSMMSEWGYAPFEVEP